MSQQNIKILEKYWDWKVPVKKELFCRGHFQLRYRKLDNVYYQIKQNKDKSWDFIVNKELDEHNRNFFTFFCFAYMHLNLWCLSEQSMKFGRFSYKKATINEQIAMNFAFDIMIPKYGLDYYLLKEGISNVEKLSNIFNVSEMHLMIQLERIGWLEKDLIKTV